ncbi:MULTISPECIES: hypothetical protein [Achromobacter]|jgi:hypothetical protein|uniref:Uncharacterized protein n=1 Tax=Achromobacter denitrificans TaxID=32002 RepID=A0A427WTD1_ACHDE|nr:MULTISPECIES: hypothetical protein [Achromobacter]OLU08905.1 hypothetical protein BVK87_07760 [Achromobacter denitrificans]QKH40640.1 hypothetical protein FOC82_03800 [Achromobacter denitrificans]QKH52215.1 hypothetical protein FOC80_23350 [Achromobacter denitrificans]QKQ48119.1 hypothetical protein FOC81_16035 [Achromobacter denitrificans]RSE85498.1 hypothetical protein EGU64_12380 [Achromobacter denitrificans]
MAWYEDQPLVTEGIDTSTVINMLQVWLPIQFRTPTAYPPHQGKLYAELTAQQKQLLGKSTEEVVFATHTLTAGNRDALRSALTNVANFDAGVFSAGVGAGMKIVLPSGWVASAVSLAVKTLVGYLLRNDETKEKVSYLSANLAQGGLLRECWHTVDMGAGNVFFHRVIQYEVNSGTELRQFVLYSTRYALKP